MGITTGSGELSSLKYPRSQPLKYINVIWTSLSLDEEATRFSKTDATTSFSLGMRQLFCLFETQTHTTSCLCRCAGYDQRSRLLGFMQVVLLYTSSAADVKHQR